MGLDRMWKKRRVSEYADLHNVALPADFESWWDCTDRLCFQSDNDAD